MKTFREIAENSDGYSDEIGYLKDTRVNYDHPIYVYKRIKENECDYDLTEELDKIGIKEGENYISIWGSYFTISEFEKCLAKWDNFKLELYNE